MLVRYVGEGTRKGTFDGSAFRLRPNEERGHPELGLNSGCPLCCSSETTQGILRRRNERVAVAAHRFAAAGTRLSVIDHRLAVVASRLAVAEHRFAVVAARLAVV